MQLYFSYYIIAKGITLLITMRTVISHNIQEARHHLLNNEVVAIPTETVYGLAGNALSVIAVIKIFAAKNRPEFNPLIVHCASWDNVTEYVTTIPPKIELLARAFSPGPISFLLPKKDIIPDMVTSGSDLVAIRIPNHPVTTELLKQLPFPLAAPSANEFGYISPTTAQHVYDSLGGKIPFILDGEQSSIGLESTIVGYNKDGQIVVHRLGGITIEEIEQELREEVLLHVNDNTNPKTSGQLKSHYAPTTPLYTGNVVDLIKTHQHKDIVTISFKDKYDDIPLLNQFILSPKGDLHEAAQNLFATLRKIDDLDADIILAEVFPDKGLGKAINDRLERAKAEYKS
jgi:L-threonylcarbamoyladenylate synthase